MKLFYLTSFLPPTHPTTARCLRHPCRLRLHPHPTPALTRSHSPESSARVRCARTLSRAHSHIFLASLGFCRSSRTLLSQLPTQRRDGRGFSPLKTLAHPPTQEEATRLYRLSVRGVYPLTTPHYGRGLLAPYRPLADKGLLAPCLTDPSGEGNSPSTPIAMCSLLIKIKKR